MFSIRGFVGIRTIVLVAAMLFASNLAQGADAPRPNILVILADDLGYSDLGCYGGEIQTPNLDRLAANGLKFTQFYNTARCWPSRGALLSGYYPQQINRDPAKNRPAWAILLPELLAPAGYQSYHSGKWHVDGPVLATGFKRSYEAIDHDRNFTPKNQRLDDKPIGPPKPEEKYYSTTAITTHALDWLAEHEKDHPRDPFFLYLAYTVPHFPLQAPAEDIARYRGKFRAGWDVLREERWKRLSEAGIVHTPLSPRAPFIPAWDSLSESEKDQWEWRMAIHAAMVDRMDQEIGRVLDQLKKDGKLDDTLILFCSDNGASAEKINRGDKNDPTAPPGSARSYLCLEPAWASLANSPFRKSKIFTHEGGISTPLIVHWPKGIEVKGELRTTPAHLIDFVPTFLELAGVSPPNEAHGENRPPLSGKSLVPTFAKDETIPRDFLYFHHEGNRGLRIGDWKIVASGPNSPWELYDLKVDRAESNNLADQYPDRVKEMAAIWKKQDDEYRRQSGEVKEP